MFGGEMLADTCMFVEAVDACAVTSGPYIPVFIVTESQEYVFFQEVFPGTGL